MTGSFVCEREGCEQPATHAVALIAPDRIELWCIDHTHSSRTDSWDDLVRARRNVQHTAVTS